jgi:hypothetical protein
MIHLIDADICGSETVQHLVTAGLVKTYSVQHFKEYDELVSRLIPTLTHEDTVILDTITSLATQTRGDFRLGVSNESVWDRHEKFFKDATGYSGYDAAQQMIMCRLRNINALVDAEGRRPQIIVTAHERDQRDALTGMSAAGPSLNEKFYETLMGSARDVFRLTIQFGDVVDEHGTVRVKDGERLLHMRASPDQIIKVSARREISEKLPKMMKDPTLPKLYKLMDKRSSWIVVYAPPGAGKTTFVCSQAQELYDAQHKTIKKA